MSFLSAFDRWLTIGLKTTALLSSALVAILLLALVLVRYVLGGNFLSAHELSLIAAVFLYMIGAVIASRNEGHLTVDILAQSLTGRRAKALQGLVVAAITLIVCGFFLLWTYEMFAWTFKRPQTTPVLRIPLWLPQLAVAIAALGCFAYTLRSLLRALVLLRR